MSNPVYHGTAKFRPRPTEDGSIPIFRRLRNRRRALLDSLILLLLRKALRKHDCRVEAMGGGLDLFLVTGCTFEVAVDRSYGATLLRGLFSKDPEILVGEGFMYGRWHMKSGALEDALSTLWNVVQSVPFLPTIRNLLNRRRFKNWQTNNPERSSQNISLHYDTENPDNELFKHMLGAIPCYSSAIFESKDANLQEAQENKIRLVIEALSPKVDDRILDIGCGWGVLTRALADTGCRVTGITLSREQLKYCRSNVKSSDDRHEQYSLSDYRSFFADTDQEYDAVTCIEVLDHIGKSQFHEFFRLVHGHLNEEGTFFLQLIARPQRGQTSGWIQKYIYPGGYIASIDEVRAAYESAGFSCGRLTHIPGAHYAQTLREWRSLFIQNWLSISEHFDEVFYRKWMFFFAYSISAFENAGFCNYHLVLQKKMHGGR